MTTPENPRSSAALRRYAKANRTASMPQTERLLRFIGAETAFADDVLGDLAEERAGRTARDGARSASWWYTREVFRSAPHLAWNAVRHGGRRGRVHVAASLGALALVFTIAVTALRVGDPVAVRLEVDDQHGAKASDGIIVNTRHPVRLAMRAFDAKGKSLKSADVRYRWMSGTPIPVSATGVITCSYPGEALVRASVGAAATTARIKCLPVREVLAPMWVQFTAGDSSQVLSFVALDPDRQPVNRLAGELRMEDSSIATLKRGRIYPLTPGQTSVLMRFGDGMARTQVIVYERVVTFEGLRDDQRFVIAPVRVAPGETIEWPLPQGLFSLQFHPASSDKLMPTLSVDGPVMCQPNFDPSVDRVECLVRGAGATVRITHPSTTPPAPSDGPCEECRSRHAATSLTLSVVGALSIEHHKYP